MWTNPQKTLDLVTITEETLMKSVIFCAVAHAQSLINFLRYTTTATLSNTSCTEISIKVITFIYLNSTYVMARLSQIICFRESLLI